jgi:glutaredoxin/glutathione-dependent peroxiredoxin
MYHRRTSLCQSYVDRFRIFELDEQGAPRAVSAAERFAGKRIVLFAVPGAFTRTCSQVHLPSFVRQADAIKAKGIDEIVCVAVNDAMVLAAWARENGATGKITMVSDGLCEFTRAVGLEQDLSERGLGMRSKRYAMIIEDGKVADIQVEPPGACDISKGEAVLQRIGS